MWIGHPRLPLALFPALKQFRHPEVQDLDDTLSGEEDVGRLDVTMDDPFFVGGLKTCRQI